MEYGTVVSINIYKQDPFEFPSIVFCSLDAYKKIGNLIGNIDSSPQDLNSQTLGVLSYETLTKRKIQYMYTSFFSSFNETIKKSVYPPLNEMILSCTYGFDLCNISDLTYYTSVNYGPCLRYTPSKPLLISGQISGLRIDFLLDPPFYDNLESQRGLNIVIKNRSEFIGSFEGNSIKPGQRNALSVSKTVSQNLPEPYTSCVADNAKYPSEIYNYILGSNYTYSQE